MTLFEKKENENPVEEKNENNGTIGERIASARKSKGQTQDDFAKLL